MARPTGKRSRTGICAPAAVNTFMVHLVGRFLSSGGTELVDEPCMADASCTWIPAPAPPH